MTASMLRTVRGPQRHGGVPSWCTSSPARTGPAPSTGCFSCDGSTSRCWSKRKHQAPRGALASRPCPARAPARATRPPSRSRRRGPCRGSAAAPRRAPPRAGAIGRRRGRARERDHQDAPVPSHARQLARARQRFRRALPKFEARQTFAGSAGASETSRSSAFPDSPARSRPSLKTMGPSTSFAAATPTASVAKPASNSGMAR